MKRSRQELCPEIVEVPLFDSRPSRSAIHPATVYICPSTGHADERLGGRQPGYVYQRDGHPNADILSEKCRRIHNAPRAVITSSGMSAITLGLISQIEAGDHVLMSNRLYGRSLALVDQELGRFGIAHSVVDMCDLQAVNDSIQANTKMLVVETISNPTLRVVDLQSLANLAHESDALLMVDNTFASPIVCQPFESGADLVVESLTKIMNGHGDVSLGLLCGTDASWDRVEYALSTWGWTSGPFDCWLAERGLSTLFLRMTSACKSAFEIANFLSKAGGVESVLYPGLAVHPDLEIAKRQFETHQGEPLFGNIVTFLLSDSTQAAADRFIQQATDIPFCPSLGDLVTTLSHPLSSSHRTLSVESQKDLAIFPGTIRLSIGLESPEFIQEAIKKGLAGLDF